MNLETSKADQRFCKWCGKVSDGRGYCNNAHMNRYSQLAYLMRRREFDTMAALKEEKLGAKRLDVIEGKRI